MQPTVEQAVVEVVTRASYLPVAAVAVPMVGTVLLVWLGRRSARIRESLAVATTALTMLPVAAMFPAVIGRHEVLTAVLPLMLSVTFRVDPMGLLFAGFTAFMWFAATLYAVGYMRHEHKQQRFYGFLLFLLSMNLGVVLAGDLMTLFMFFEALGLLGYYVVIHAETPDAFAAGAKFIWMAIVGGLCLLAGTLLLAHYAGSWSIAPALQLLARVAAPTRYLIAGLMILGFGVKAGMIPVHTWLPDAHPVAPSPASALLSGVMIKAGAYGIIRVGATIMRPPIGAEGEAAGAAGAAEGVAHAAGAAGEAAAAVGAWLTTSTIGYWLIWVGVVTMFLGVVMALLQENSKRMLAYHSISQMGYILMGAGCGAYLAEEGGLAFGASMFHVVNHALFKGLLFLGVGAVFFRTGELNMYKLGGLWRKMPITFLCTLVAALAISGIPPLNGFASKTLLHHAIVEAFEHRELVSLRWAEIIFIITGGGTLGSFMKLIIFTFLGKRDERFDGVKEAPAIMLVAMYLIAVPIVLLGVFPGLMTSGFLVPAAEGWALATERLAASPIFTLHNLQALVPSLAVGVGVFVVGVRFGLFHIHFPAWFGVDYWYLKVADQIVPAARAVGVAYRAVAGSFGVLLSRSLAWYGSTRTLVGRRYRRFSISFFSRLTRMIELEKRRYRRPMLTLLFGAPVLREFELACRLEDALNMESFRMVEAAVKGNLEALRRRRLSPATRQLRLDAIRRNAYTMAGELCARRMADVREAVAEAPPELIVDAFGRAEERMRETREAVVKAAGVWAREGRVVPSEQLAEAAAALHQSEGFAEALRGLVEELKAAEAPAEVPAEMATWHVGTALEARTSCLVTRERLAASNQDVMELLNEVKAWVGAMARGTLAAMMEERVPWDFSYSLMETERTRVAIRRYSRDMSLNVLLVSFISAVTAVLLVAANR